MKVENYFERQAYNFDQLYEAGGCEGWFNRAFRAALYKRVALTLAEIEGLAPFTLLDVGCGSGRNEPLFAQAGASRIVGIDFASQMLELAREFAKKSGVDHACEFVDGDFMANDFADKFDVVTALGVFDYVEEPVKVLTRMRELARKRVIASFPGYSLVRAPLRKLRYALLY
jgi:ubiquinone/menaquinone biosynthesis C-methylase UbiE